MPTRHQRKSNVALAFALATCSLVCLTGQAASDGRMKRLPDEQVISPQQLATSQTTVRETRASGPPMVLPVGVGTLLHLSSEAASVFIVNPDVADVQIATKQSFYVFAKKPGRTVVYATGNDGQVLLSKTIDALGPMLLMHGSKIGDEPVSRFLVIPTQPIPPDQSASR